MLMGARSGSPTTNHDDRRRFAGSVHCPIASTYDDNRTTTPYMLDHLFMISCLRCTWMIDRGGREPTVFGEVYLMPSRR